jgi:hypothetical protein
MQGIGVPPYSARGLTQTLAHIDQASSSGRDVNGNLIDLSFSGFRKYKSTISGTDQLPPNVNGVWPGQQVVVDCIAELSMDEGSTPDRTVVPDSLATEGAHSTFRPRLTMLVMSFNLSQDEYGRQIDWSMDLEEV